jgi:hypothetical protein
VGGEDEPHHHVPGRPSACAVTERPPGRRPERGFFDLVVSAAVLHGHTSGPRLSLLREEMAGVFDSVTVTEMTRDLSWYVCRSAG